MNIDTSHDPDLKNQTNLRPFIVYAFDGNKKTEVTDLAHLPKDKPLVAVIGLVLDDMPNIAPNVGKLKFENMQQSAQKTVDYLESLGIQNIVALTHIDHAKDQALASQVNGIDVIVGGHSHTLLGDHTNLGLNNNGQYAQWITNPNQTEKTCVVQAGEYAQAMGRLQVQFDGKGQIIRCEGQNTLLSNDQFYHQAQRSADTQLSTHDHDKIVAFIDQQDNMMIVKEDAHLRHHINDTYKPAVDKAYGTVITQVPTEIKHERRPGDKGTDKHGSDVAPLLAEAQYYWANTPEVQKITGHKIDFALIGAGGIRKNIEAGEYREGNVSLELLPFSNFMSVLPVQGSVIRDLLQETVNATLAEGAHAGKFPYSGHLRYQFTETKAHQQGQIDHIEVMSGTEQAPIWTPLNNNQTYYVAINNYNATGNDGWTALYKAQQSHSGRIDLAYLNGKLTGFKVKNITEKDGQYKVNYQGKAPNCKAAVL